MSRYYVTRSFTQHNPQGRPIVGQEGSKISESVYNRLSARLQRLCIPARQAPRNGDFTLDECQFLVKSYLAGQTDRDTVEAFYQQFPNHKMNDGVACQLRIIAGCDNTTEDNGLENPGRLLLTAMMTVMPSRFV